MNLSDMRARLRTDLHDEDSQNYRWTDGELDRHIQHTVRQFSLALPLEAKTTLATTAESRDISITTLTDLVAIEAVEYPVGEYPPSYMRFSVWLGTLTLLIDSAPAGRERRRVPHEAADDRRDVIYGPTAVRGRDRGGRGWLRGGRVVVVRNEPCERGRAGRLARVPDLGSGAAG